MKPKLIILNGPPAIGKSTLAEKYASEHPLTLNLDVDKIRALISQWRERDQESGPIAKKMAVALARIHLEAGHDVIIPQMYRQTIFLEELETVARSCNANLYEFLFIVSKEETIKRFIERGQAHGHSSGFRPGGIIERKGGVKALERFHEDILTVAAQRPNTITIEPIQNGIDGTYAELMKHLE